MLDLLRDGIQIAAFGMTAVFVLLGCLVLALGAMSRLAAALDPSAVAGSLTDADKVELTVAVAAAIHVHRRRGR